MNMVESLVDLKMMGVPSSVVAESSRSLNEYLDAFIEAAVDKAIEGMGSLMESLRPGRDLKRLLHRIEQEQAARGGLSEAEMKRVEDAAVTVFDKAAKQVAKRGFWGNAWDTFRRLIGLAPEKAEGELGAAAQEVGDTFDDYEMEAEDTAMTLRGALTFFDSRKGSILQQIKRRIMLHVTDAGHGALFLWAVAFTALGYAAAGASGVFWLWVAVLVYRVVQWMFFKGVTAIHRYFGIG